MTYLNIKQIVKKYQDKIILNKLDLTVDKGEFLTILGASGCGKSTLLRVIAGLDWLNSGQIILNNRDITFLSPQKRNISMVFQQYALFPNMNVVQNISFGLKMQKKEKDVIAEKVATMVSMMELNEHQHKYPHELSGGQKQRVALARALVIEPDLLLLDEPLSALDAKIRKNLRAQIFHIQRKLNIATIFVTHDQEEALIMSDRIILMKNGGIVENQSPEQLYSRPSSKFSAEFIGHYNLVAAHQIGLKELEQNQLFAIRPETITLQRNPGDFKATIIHRQLLGNIIRYTIQLENSLQLSSDVLNIGSLSQLSVGETVFINITKEILIPLPLEP